jgi:hypothetical protein
MTRASVIPAEDRAFLEPLSRLMLCNPFLAERNKLEQEVLGAAYCDTPKPWNIDYARPERDPNIEKLRECWNTRSQGSTARSQRVSARQKLTLSSILPWLFFSSTTGFGMILINS